MNVTTVQSNANHVTILAVLSVKIPIF